MKNFVQPGDVVTVTAPTGGVVSGQPLLVGFLFGVCAYSAIATKPVELALEGVFDLPKDASTFAVGAKIYWDATAKLVTSTSTSNTLVGVATAAAGTGEATARVRLNEVIT